MSINTKNLKILLITICLLFTASINHAISDPNTLLGEAIKKNLTINDNLPQEDRLKAYKEIFALTEKIISDHSSSDQAIKLLSNQKVGDFDQNVIRANYIKELTEYYDIVCETSPSFLCLGFVSLKIGQDGCKSANTVRQIVEAHQNLKNSVNIFSGQKSDPAFINLSLDLYRNCLNESPFEATDYSKDLFALDLTKMMLLIGKESNAKAMIQNMKTPSFKVEGVLALSESQNKPFDRAFYDRLVKFINEKVQDINGSKAAASLALSEDAFKRGDFKISFDDARSLISYTNFGDYSKKCDPFFTRNLVNRAFLMQYNIANLEKERRGYNKSQLPSILESVSKNFGTDVCYDKTKDTGEYSLSLQLYGNILLLSKEAALKFKNGVMNEDWSSNKQLEFAIRELGKYKELFEAEYGLTEKAKGSQIVKFEGILKKDRALFPVYKQLVDYSNVCESSKLLFQKIKGKNYFDDAIEYMVSSDKINVSEEQKCGDSELELLLN